MTDLRIRITESDGIRYATGVNPYASTIYIGESIPDTLDAILDGLQDYAHAEPAAMVRALHFCPEFCQLAAAVHGLHLAESDETPEAEAIAILTKLRDSRQPEAIRTRAGNLLIDIVSNPLPDHVAVCDASSVDERPGQDAGEALVGEMCFVWSGKWIDGYCANPVRIEGIENGNYRAGFPSIDGSTLWQHAHPTYLGLPEVTP